MTPGPSKRRRTIHSARLAHPEPIPYLKPVSAADPILDPILERARNGERAALAKILEEVGPRVRGRIESKLSPAIRTLLDADDVMQVTYMEVVLRLKSFSGGGTSGFVAWVTRLAENNLIDAVRALEAAKRLDPRKKITANRNDSATALVAILGVTHTTPSRIVAKDEAGAMIEVALRALPPDYETVVRLHDLEQRPMAEIAQILKRSEGAAYMLRARAHDRLKEILGSDSKFFSTPGH